MNPLDEAADVEGNASVDADRSGRWPRTVRLLVASVVITVSAFLILAAAFGGRTVSLPEWARQRIEIQLNNAMPDGAVELGGVAMEVRRGALPRVTLQNLTLVDGGGARIADLNAVQARLKTEGLVRGEFNPARIDLTGAQITFRRSATGRIAVSFGGAFEGADQTLSGLLDDLDALFDAAPLTTTEQIRADALTITLEDARSGRIWQASNASLELVRTDDALDLSLTSEVFNGTEALAELSFAIMRDRGSSRTDFAASVRNMPANDIALQSPILAYLGVLDAPISGDVYASLNGFGLLEDMTARLEIGNGSLRPTPETRPVAFQSGLASFRYDPSIERLTFDELSIETSAGRGSAIGHAYLRDRIDGWPSVLLGQIEVKSAELASSALVPEAVALASGNADFRLRLDPFILDIGQMSLGVGASRLSAQGRLATVDDGWSVSVDARVDEMSPATLMTIWPTGAAPGARRWVAKNLTDARIVGLNASVRSDPGSKPVAALDFSFEDTSIRYLPDHPAIEDAVGHGSIYGDRFTLFIQKGFVQDPQKGKVAVDGSTLTIADIAAKPARAEISLETSGSLAAHLSLLSLRPVLLEERAGFALDRANAQFRARGEIAFDLNREVTPEDVAWRASGVLENVQSQTLVPNRIFAADTLDVNVTPRGIAIMGQSVVDGVRFNGQWSQAFGPGVDGTSTITGVTDLTPETMSKFGITLPPGSVDGKAEADLMIELAKGQAPELALASSLEGMSLRIAPLNWSKPANSEAEFVVEATLGENPKIESVSLTAAGLRSQGRVLLRESGEFMGLELDRLRTGGWLDAGVRVTSQGPGSPPRIELRNGTIDVRQLRLSGGAGRSSGTVPIDLALDRAILAEGLELRSVEGRLSTGSEMRGTFRGRVNGGATVEGALIPVTAGTAIRLQAADAGAVFRDAGIFKTAYGGVFDLILSPTAGAGVYDGQMLVERVSLRGAAPLAALIDAISVVGLLDELNGPGILFENVDAQFTLTPSQVRIQRASAVGPSIGVSLDGIYTLAARTVDFQGVISPVYFLNGIGAIFTRRGEGLFGFNFTMKGAADTPSIAVNPLSLLTPGMFREIFRRPPPSPTQ